MRSRKCCNCNKEIDLPHVRVWEEDVRLSRMLTFCGIVCMIRHYNYNDVHPETVKRESKKVIE